MSTSITIDAADVATAADFLEQYLGDQVPLGDFSKGTALRDIALQAIAAITAFLRADAAQIRQMQSLKTIQAATGGDPEALRDGVTAILSNLLVPLKPGARARGYALGHATRRVDVFVPATTRFVYRQGTDFVVDSPGTLFIPASELVPVIEADGVIVDYEFRIPLIAVTAGEGYNIEPGLFASFDRFNPYITRIEANAAFAGGTGPETVEQVLARAPTAVATRNLVNDRSIPATLHDNFADIEAIFIAGMGAPEMQRDLLPGGPAHLRVHGGGMVDIYPRTALVETTVTRTIGDPFARPDNLVTLFTDPLVPFTGVVPGDVLRITAGLPAVPAEFLIVEVDGDTLVTHERTPFPIASDEADPPTTVSYTIGRSTLAFNDIVAAAGGQPYTTGVTSRQVGAPGRITLPGGPVMDILDVAILNPTGLPANLVWGADGLIHFTRQVSRAPETATVDQGLEFQVIVHNPQYAQSSAQWLEVVVGTATDPSQFDGRLLRVRYRTVASFDAIDAFVRGRRERLLAAHQIVRGHHPVVVTTDLRYTLQPTAPALLDDAAIVKTIADYITNYDAADAPIDVSSIIALVKATYPTIGNIVPAQVNGPLMTITYALRAPTGDVLAYSTTDVVEVTPAKQVDGPTTVMLADYGVTARTLRFVANEETVTVSQAGS